MPPMPPATNTPTMIPLPREGQGSASWWSGRLDWDTQTRRALLPGWRKNANAYRNKLKPETPDGIRVNIEYEKTEQKKYQLFYRLPAIKLRPSPRTMRESLPQPTIPGMPVVPPRDLKRAVSIFKEVVMRLIGPKMANCAAMMGEVIFDVLCPSGIAFAKIGYERFTDGHVQVPTGAMIDDPNFQQPGSVLGLTPVPQIPELALTPNVIAEQYYASRISPALGIVPSDFRGSDYARDADYLGHDFPMAEEAMKARGWIVSTTTPGDMSSGGNTFEEDRIVELNVKGTAREGQAWCREIFYYAQRIDPTVKHPQKIRRLVFVHGQPNPVVHEDYKGQRFDARGRLVAGVKTLPIKVLTLRYVSDSAHPPSDCEITSQYGKELSEFRSGQMQHRRKAIPRTVIDVSRILDQSTKDAILAGKHYADIPVDGNPNNIAADMGRPSYPSENWRANDAVMDDTNRAWALGATQSATTEASGTTATEIAAIGQATATRLGGEREIVVSRFLMGIIEDLASLFQLFADREDYVEILGPDGEKKVEAFTNQDVMGEFLFEAVPDSTRPPDASADRDLALNAYNLLANDPFVNREQLVRDVMDAYGLDADRLVRVPEPPKPVPEKPKVSLSFKGDDLAPMMPQYANVAAILASEGILANPIAAQAPPVETPPATTDEGATGPANVVDRERLRMAVSDEGDKRSPGGLVSVGAR